MQGGDSVRLKASSSEWCDPLLHLPGTRPEGEGSNSVDCFTLEIPKTGRTLVPGHSPPLPLAVPQLTPWGPRSHVPIALCARAAP